MPPRAFGIDLGTTYSAVAYLDDRGRTAMVRNAAGETLTPSVVFFSDDETVVGREAKKYLTLWPDAVAECVKRDMGEAIYSKPIRGKQMPPEVIQACILRQLNADAVAALGTDLKAVITVPAYFDERRRQATAQAAELAGIDLLDIVNEPTAAALSFGESLGYLAPTGEPGEPLKVLVYDLGGGTFDVTVIDLRPGDIATLATDGDVRLGGRDWDEALLNHVAERFMAEAAETAQAGRDPRKDPIALGELWVSVEEAKRTLSVRDRATIPVRHAGRVKDITVTVEQFEELTEPLLERTSLTTRQVIAAAGVTWDQIDRVLLVGGATRMRMVGRMLTRLSGKKPDQSVHPDEAVARGAAIFAGYRLAQSPADEPEDVFAENIQFTEIDDDASDIAAGHDAEKRSPDVAPFPSSTAADLAARQLDRILGKTSHVAGGGASGSLASRSTAVRSETHRPARDTAAKQPRDRDKNTATFRVTNVNSHSLGIEGIHRKTDRKQNVVLIPRNTPLPARISHHFVTKEEGQRSVVVQVLEGDNADPQECSRVGRAVLRDLPDRLPRGWPVEVVYEYGANGRLSVYARVPRTESKVTVDFEHDKALASERVRRWRRVIEANPGFDTFEALLEDVLHESEPKSASSDGAGTGAATIRGEANTVADPARTATMALPSETESPPTGDEWTHTARDVPVARRPKRRNWAITIIGHILAPVIGLLIGYYVLALLTPRGNFLNLPLPGLKTVEDADADR